MQLKDALDGSRLRWETSDEMLRRRDPYGYPNFGHTLQRVNKYMECMTKCGSRWLDLRYRFPLIWLPTRQYQQQYQVQYEKDYWMDVLMSNGYRGIKEDTVGAYNLTTLHIQEEVEDSD
jgi:hypothetical protein